MARSEETALAGPKRVGGQALALAALAPWVPVALFLVDNAKKVATVTPLLVLGGTLSGVGLAVTWAGGVRGGRSLARRVAVGWAVGVVWFFLFGRFFAVDVAPASRAWLAIGLWALSAGLLIYLAVRASSSPGFRQFLTLAVAIVVVLGLVNAAVVGWQRRAVGPLASEAPAGGVAVRTPNIYWFVVDEFARTDQLARVTGYDNRGFDDALRERGFTVATASTAAYPHTHLSIASTLMMEYPFTGADELGSNPSLEFDRVAPVVRGENAVVRRLRQLGYSFIYAAAGPLDWSACDPAVADVCLSPDHDRPWTRDPLAALLRPTPAALLTVPHASTDPGRVVDQLADIGSQYEPFFLFAHVLAPHQPFRYTSSCARRAVRDDGERLSGEERAAAYADEVRCLSADLVAAVDRIQASDPEAIIIIQGDHGSKLTLDWSEPLAQWTDASLQERFAPLDARRLPQGCPGEGDHAALVNTFRVVLACLEDRPPELLAPRSFWTSFEDLPSLREVTDRLQ